MLWYPVGFCSCLTLLPICAVLLQRMLRQRIHVLHVWAPNLEGRTGNCKLHNSLYCLYFYHTAHALKAVLHISPSRVHYDF